MTSTGGPSVGATLRLLDKADKEIVKLDRAIVGAVYKFQHEFRKNPEAPGFDLKPLKGHERLWSARVNREYRALLVRLGGNDWLLVSVKHRGHVHRNLDRFAYGINQITGAIEYVDLHVVEEDVLGEGDPGSTRRGRPGSRRPRSAAVRRLHRAATGRPGCGRAADPDRSQTHYGRRAARTRRVRSAAHRRGAAAAA